MDSTLILAIKKGDTDAFKQFYSQYFERSIRVAYSLSQNTEIAKEAVQETFVRVFRHVGTFDTTKPFDPWFFRILTNECNRLLKKEGRTLLLEDEQIENHHSHTETSSDTDEEVREVLDTLDDIYRIPLTLKYIQGFTEAEIAYTLDLNINTVKTRLFKAREKMKAQMERLGVRRSDHV